MKITQDPTGRFSLIIDRGKTKDLAIDRNQNLSMTDSIINNALTDRPMTEFINDEVFDDSMERNNIGGEIFE